MNIVSSYLCHIFLRPIVDRFLIKKATGLENIPKRNFIIATNHQSHLDQIVTGYVCVPRKYHYIGQTDRYSGLTKLGLYILYFLAGVIHVNRKKPESRRRALEECIRVLKKGACLVIYPEGTRTRTGEIQEGKWGVAKIFLRTEVPILPVGIKGTFELLPPGGKLRIKRIVEINVGKPLFFEKEFSEAKKTNENSKEYQEICQKITDKIMEEITDLSKEI
ncbi:1-acyl-sn-glycerol-3-phosphate acyltransferase [Patescibacteria group bacterium]|nr:1-acyl-sn-glycerol-3-phosphate acyltransferase [Patescibacteria group bacterium]